ncbi:hypothetical protein OOT46_19790 [Aquabacterium sp. A7-Y]|uniref:hypothetical protein n=1 Tax=Aquabacterium sp. A7-Y TaxID=1349605 RepID=UPI00223C8EC2|nr:hypothetical protein [Aquabacterium sp. A7-Y]MCW7540081.1 hypothetical protein [Aquabacterium sp. A7-Y]
MDKKLHLLETFTAVGSDGTRYKVLGYEHLARDPSLGDTQDRWEPTGMAEYKLASGEHVDLLPDGALLVPSTGLRLERRPGA